MIRAGSRIGWMQKRAGHSAPRFVAGSRFLEVENRDSQRWKTKLGVTSVSGFECRPGAKISLLVDFVDEAALF